MEEGSVTDGETNYTYMLRLSDGSLYTGWTNNLKRRLAAHEAGTASKCTRSRRPLTLVYYETHATKSEAMRREALIKRMTKAEKEALVQGKVESKAEKEALVQGQAEPKAGKEALV